MNGTRVYGGPETTDMSKGPWEGSADLATKIFPYLTCKASMYGTARMGVTVWLLSEIKLMVEVASWFLNSPTSVLSLLVKLTIEY
jgi:hypothetical protein